MGHDLGHTPFGHAGEKVLNSLVTGGFRHNEQSLRVVEKLENGKGLNLTFEVRDGILNHPSDCRAATPEGRIVSLSDRIAYINHDIDDAVRAGILNESDLPKSCVELLGASHGERINTLILDTIANSFDSAEIRMSSEVWDEFKRLRDFMFERVYLNKNAKHEETKGMHVIAELFKYYKEHIDELPEDFKKNVEEDGNERVAADWIACMSDRYAISDYEKKVRSEGMDVKIKTGAGKMLLQRNIISQRKWANKQERGDIMAAFPEEWLNELLSKTDIVRVVGDYVSLTPKGGRFWGCCPFHNEKTPSFSVTPEKQMYYCFGCHAGGGVIHFVMEAERVS